MLFVSRDKERERYYLLPGQGGRRAWSQKIKSMILWGLSAGMAASLVVGVILYFLSRHGKGGL